MFQYSIFFNIPIFHKLPIFQYAQSISQYTQYGSAAVLRTSIYIYIYICIYIYIYVDTHALTYARTYVCYFNKDHPISPPSSATSLL